MGVAIPGSDRGIARLLVRGIRAVFYAQMAKFCTRITSVVRSAAALSATMQPGISTSPSCPVTSPITT
jgi:hypothetical protein